METLYFMSNAVKEISFRRQNVIQKMGSWVFHFDHHLVLLLLMSFQLHLSTESGIILPGQRLSRNQTLISKDGVFEMGLFSPPGNSHNYYVGIWYKRLPMPEKTVVWVANRDRPVSDPYSSWLELGEDGNLSLYTSNGRAVWSTNSNFSLRPSDSVVGALGDDGNFIISNISNKTETYIFRIWQSFDYPTDTWLPGAKFGYDKDRGVKTILRSWQSTSNPSTGRFSAEVSGVQPESYEAQLLLKNGFNESEFCIHESDYWSVNDVNLYYFRFACGYLSRHYSDSCVVMSFFSYSPDCLARYVLDVSGKLKLFIWSKHMESWGAISKHRTTCDSHRWNKRMKAKKGGKNNATWIVTVTVVGLASVFVAITVLLIRLRNKGTTTSSKAMGGDTLKQYKYRDLRRATRNFTCRLGNGGFSTVYKGEFPDSTFIAVKELQGHFQEEKQLRAELNTVGLIQHKNLVRLCGFCLEGSKRFIIYDYMPNGSLESHLFRSDPNVLDWGTRYRIALGTAKGLAYLHEECRDCIIHCDVKPENILLDAEFNPQVGDFGLAKLLGRNFSRVLTTTRGTRGYLAPEWFSGVPITAKVDVYSYGQVLLEIISGRRNVDILNDDLTSYFPALVLNALNNGEDVLPLVDSKIEGELNVEEVTRACKVASWCIQDDEKERPTMKQVVQVLEGLLFIGISPIPLFLRSIAEPSMQKCDMKDSEVYSTSSTLPSSFTFQPPALSIQHVP